MKPQIKVAFATGSDDLLPEYLERFDALAPDLELYVVSEFAPPRGRWIRYHVGRSFRENISLLRAVLQAYSVRYAAVFMQPKMPYWRLRALAPFTLPKLLLVYNETLEHFPLHPRGLPAMIAYASWRFKNLIRWELSPGSFVYTLAWRIVHPRAFHRPWLYWRARVAGRYAALQKRLMTAEPTLTITEALPEGVSVVVPSRNGRELLARLLPGVLRELEGIDSEIIVVDNGSSDATAQWLSETYPQARVIVSSEPLSFAKAVNRGIAAASFSHVCLLNNDMVVHPGFFAPLLDAFRRVPSLFCATAQIFFPEGQRRQETGKAVLPELPPDRKDPCFPVWCDQPIEGENLSYVLYGSGGCSLYDTAKARTLGGLDEIYEPAYVEDLDFGYRGWLQGWPAVFVASAMVTHDHRTTTSRYYSAEQLEETLERNYLRFLARCIHSPRVFAQFWKDALARLNIKSVWEQKPALRVLKEAVAVSSWVRKPAVAGLPEEQFMALASGAVSVFPGRQPSGKPVVLIAAPYIPFPLSHGGAVRMFNLMARAAAEYDQALITFCDELKRPPRELLELCVEVVQVRRSGRHDLPSSGRPDVVEEFDSPAFHAVIREMVRKWRPAIAQLEFTQMAQYATDCRPAQTVLVEHDITLDLYTQLLAKSEDWELRLQRDRWERFERDAWRHVDCVVAMSRKDARTVTEAKRVATLINGVDLERFQPSDDEPEPGRILFIGSFAHLPNVIAVDWFLHEAWPYLRHIAPSLHIIAGSRHQYFLDLYKDRVQPNLAQPGIEVEDFVADVRPAYRRASAVIAPLQASAGTNIKIMEAMAMAKAIVSTRGGVNGLDVNAGHDFLLAEDGPSFARAIQDLLASSSLRREVELSARQTAVKRYSWDGIAAEQSRMYRQLISDSRP